MLLDPDVTVTSLACRWPLLEQACRLRHVRLSQQKHMLMLLNPDVTVTCFGV